MEKHARSIQMARNRSGFILRLPLGWGVYPARYALAIQGEGGIFLLMPTTWKIVVATESVAGGPRTVEYFLVAVPDQVAALIALRQRRPDLIGGDFSVEGEASPEFVEWLNAREGQVLSIVVL
jgi:hypothetical protein